MKKVYIIILILLIAAFAAGVYLSDRVRSFKQVSIADTLSQIEKQIFDPPPLKIGGLSKSVTLLQSEIIAETNLQRQENGNLPALTENSRLDDAAAAKANDMFLNQYFEHVSPTGVDPGKLVQSKGYNYIVAGENLILGNFSSEKELVQDWMNSPGHRANILNKRFSEIGVAIIRGTYKGEKVWIGVQEFGLPLSSCSEPNKALKDQIDSEKTQLDIMATQINDMKTQINSTNQGGAVYKQMVDDYNQVVLQYNSLADQLKQQVAVYNEDVNTFNNCVAGK